MSAALAASGAFGYVILALGVVGVLVNLAMAGLALSKRRVPLAALVAAPLLALALGALGSWLYAGGVWSSVDAAEGSEAARLAFEGSYKALWSDWIARWSAAIALAVGVWAAAAGSLVPGEEGRFTPVAAGMVLATTFVGCIVSGWYAATHGGGFSVVALLAFVGTGVAVAASRRANDEQMFRLAGMRFAAGVCAVLAVWHAGRALDIGTQIRLFTDDGALVAVSDMNVALEKYAELATGPFGLAVLALLFALVVAAVGCFAELGEVFQRYTMFDLLAVVALGLVSALARALAIGRTGALFEVGSLDPATHAYREILNGLSPAVLAEGETSAVVAPVRGGFGDVFEREPAANGKYEWVRTERWTGRGWSADHTELANADVHERPPLIVIEGSQQVKEILPLLEKSGGRGYILQRASEAKAGTSIPPELKRLAVSFFPVELSTTRDLKSELWTEAGSLQLMWGPTSWYGEGEDLDPTKYNAAVAAATQAKGLHVLIGERRINDLITTCMPFVVDKTETGYDLSDRWCRISTEDATAFRTDAAAAWPLPEAANVTMSLAITGPLDPAEVTDRLNRELGALSWCVDQAVKANEPVAGEMVTLLGIAKDGSVFDTRLDEKSAVQSPTMLRCSGKRFRGMAFTVPEPTPPPPPVEGEEPPPPPIPPGVTVTLQITAPPPTETAALPGEQPPQ
ncbi:MAG: hypothetical protein H0V89_13440 [Deltaproteobacteria bacterium]|nr:hypothetical protein [Deltaproteobacteria bacterium]